MDSFDSSIQVANFSDVVKLVQIKAPEDLHLEYKSGNPRNPDQFKNDLAQDVSAFANSDGGTLIVGVCEEDCVPTKIDGVNEKSINRESLGQVIASKVSPPIPGLRIETLRGPDNSVLVVTVPQSPLAPHQGPNHKYYRRYQHHNQPMAHHEIEDLRRRQLQIEPLVIVSPSTRGGVLTVVEVSNPGPYPANDVTFKFSSNRLWPNMTVPKPLASGIRYLGPGQRHFYNSESFSQLWEPTGTQATFLVDVEYTHSKTLKRMSHTWPLDFESYRDSMEVPTDSEQDRRDTLNELKKLREAVTTLTNCLSRCLPKLAGANGLDLSVYSLRNIKNIMDGKPIERLSPRFCHASDFQSALGIDRQLAVALERHFRDHDQGSTLSNIPGMTDEIMDAFEKTFSILRTPGSDNP